MKNTRPNDKLYKEKLVYNKNNFRSHRNSLVDVKHLDLIDFNRKIK